MKLRRFKHWTKEEDAYLIENYKDKTAEELARALDRSIQGVRCRLNIFREEGKILGFMKRKKYKQRKRNWWERKGPRK